VAQARGANMILKGVPVDVPRRLYGWGRLLGFANGGAFVAWLLDTHPKLRALREVDSLKRRAVTNGGAKVKAKGAGR
jgi:hypothetical protein